MQCLRIGVNALYLIPGGVGGTEVYQRCVLAALARIDPVNRYFIFTNRETGPDLVPDAANFVHVPQPVTATTATIAPALPTATPAAPSPPPLPASLVGTQWSRLPTAQKLVALTFDAGNNDGGVASILATLRSTGTPALYNRVSPIHSDSCSSSNTTPA